MCVGALELMAALPLVRPASVRPGPLQPPPGRGCRSCCPPPDSCCCGGTADYWGRVPEVRFAAAVLMIITAALAALRAFSRREWIVSLRWLVIVDSVLAGALVALRAVPDDAALLLWMAPAAATPCCSRANSGGGAWRGDRPRRLWRLAVWVALASLSLPVLTALGFGPRGVAQPLLALVAAFAVAFAALVSVRRMAIEPERRTMVRRESAVPLAQLGAIGCLLAGPLGLLFSWWGGYALGVLDTIVIAGAGGPRGWTAGRSPIRARPPRSAGSPGSASLHAIWPWWCSMGCWAPSARCAGSNT